MLAVTKTSTNGYSQIFKNLKPRTPAGGETKRGDVKPPSLRRYPGSLRIFPRGILSSIYGVET